MATITVGTGAGSQFATIAAAVAASQSGDVIEVQAGTYTNDFPATITHDLTIEGVGGMVNMVASATDPANPDLTLPSNNLKGILVIGSGPGNEPSVTLRNMSFSGASIPNDLGGNGAGIRYQSGNLTLDHAYVFDNQDGLLGGADAAGTINIQNSEFYNNGNPAPPGSGIEHNLYVGQIASLTVDNSYFLDPVYGNNIKSRAASTLIENSRIVNPTGTGNYAIDAPSGGNLVVTNSVIEQGPNGGNNNLIAYGEEGTAYASNAVTITGNVIENDVGSGQVLLNPTSVQATISGNAIYGTYNAVTNGPVGSLAGNTFLASAGEPALATSQPFLPVADVACFAAGTRIMTPDGDVPVEALRAGHLVVVSRTGPGVAALPVRWIGHRRIDLRGHPDPRAVRPVRILADALADGVPRRDLLLSPDHAVLVAGRLIPVRLLLNGATILQDGACPSVSYFHIELDRHGILLAEGLEAETYLETGNRNMFDNWGPGAAASAAQGQSLRESASCAPFTADAQQVEPVWRTIAIRASLLGFDLRGPAEIDDPALRLVAGGMSHRPIASVGARRAFRIAGPCASARIRSRATPPCDVRPWIEDRRSLGVAVGRIVVTTESGPVEIMPDDPALTEGWWDVEREGGAMRRWTDGNALLTLPAGASAIDIHLAGVTPYLLGAGKSVPSVSAGCRHPGPSGLGSRA